MSSTWEVQGILTEIANVAGREAALALARRYGGTVIRVPRFHRHLVRAPWRSEMTDEAANAIWHEFRGDRVYVPLCRPAVGCWLVDQGFHPAAIAAELKVSLRTVQRWVAQIRKGPPRTNE